MSSEITLLIILTLFVLSPLIIGSFVLGWQKKIRVKQLRLKEK